jgi:hypothetical protein
MVTVEHNGKSYEIPGVLDELSAEQYQGYLFLAVMMRRGIIDETGFRAKLLAELMGLKVDITDFKPDVAEALIAQLGVLDGFLDEKGPITATGRNLLPEFAGWKARVGDMLNGLAFGDFVEALTLLGRLDEAEESQQAVLNELARLLYSPPEDKADAEVPALVAVHSVTLLTSVFNMIRTEPIGISGELINFSIIFKPVPGVPSKADDHTGWHGIAMEVASSGVFGTLKDVNVTPLWDVLLYLYRAKFDLLHEKRK